MELLLNILNTFTIIVMVLVAFYVLVGWIGTLLEQNWRRPFVILEIEILNKSTYYPKRLCGLSWYMAPWFAEWLLGKFDLTMMDGFNGKMECEDWIKEHMKPAPPCSKTVHKIVF